MKRTRSTSLLSLLLFFSGPIACSDAGDIRDDNPGRDSQELTASGASREASAEPDSPGSTSSLTIGTPRSSESVTQGTAGSSTLSPTPNVSGGEVREEQSNSELSPTTITWTNGDAGAEVQLGVDLEQACAGLLSACLAAGETEQECEALMAECEEAVASPPAPTNDIGFVSSCEEMGEDCRAAGIAPEECAKAVAVCNSPDAGATPAPVSFVEDCEELRATCAAAGASADECDQVVAACENPPAAPEPSVGLAPDCASVVATCLAGGIDEEECKKAQEICEGDQATAGGNDIRLK